MASASDLANTLQKDHLTCPICLDPFVKPRSLQCNHTFCEACLKPLVERKEVRVRTGQVRFVKTVTCPICRKVAVVPGGGVACLAPNFLAMSLTESLSATALSAKTDLAALSANTDLASGSPNQTSNSNCVVHPGKLVTHFCVECEEQLCTACVTDLVNKKNFKFGKMLSYIIPEKFDLVGHRHKVVELNFGLKTIASSLEKSMENVKNFEMCRKKEIEQVKTYERELTKNRATVLAAIDSHARGLKEKIAEWQTKMEMDLTERCNKKKLEIDSSQKYHCLISTRDKAKNVQEAAKTIVGLLEKGDTKALENYKKLRETHSNFTEFEPTRPPILLDDIVEIKHELQTPPYCRIVNPSYKPGGSEQEDSNLGSITDNCVNQQQKKIRPVTVRELEH